MFSQPVRQVSRTRIFARGLADDRQLLVYSMHLDADGDLAMVLPVPTPPSSPEDAVRFVDMSACPTFFDQLAAMFPDDRALMGGDLPAQFGAPRALLRVHAVGEFVASFVPTRADFDRLDPRFRLAPSVWDAMPEYADWGYCVFQLRSSGPEAPPAEPPGLMARVHRFFAGDAHAAASAHGATRKYHPMAFEFPRRDASSLFFPTKHVHDGAVHATAEFDHSLYCQVPAGASATTDDTAWQVSPIVAGHAQSAYVGPAAARAWLDADAPVHRRELRGDLANRDVIAR